jgi:TPR repeat protein
VSAVDYPAAAAPSGLALPNRARRGTAGADPAGSAVTRRIARAAACVLFAAGIAPAGAVPGGHGSDAALQACLAQRNGIGQAADPAAARRCLQHVAEDGAPAAMFLLAQMLADGDGGARDDAAAHAWLERAAELDYPEALQALALAEPDGERAEGLMRAAAHALAHRAYETRAVRQGLRQALRRE